MNIATTAFMPLLCAPQRAILTTLYTKDGKAPSELVHLLRERELGIKSNSIKRFWISLKWNIFTISAHLYKMENAGLVHASVEQSEERYYLTAHGLHRAR